MLALAASLRRPGAVFAARWSRTKFRLPHVQPITIKEYRMASKERKNKFPPCHSEFMTLMSQIEICDGDSNAPAVVEATKLVELCQKESEHKTLYQQKSSLGFHLSKHLKHRNK
mmetsp:Transcript_27763/g.93306  ORF Transcript_27763/g.93306 Transcript_27763/m.93306 type:complete len:114 (+) Transcript_27763:87-428(+)